MRYGSKIVKYVLPSRLTVENAAKLVERVRKGTAKPFWRSDLGLLKVGEQGRHFREVLRIDT
jgi:hypothetical protein